MEVTVHEAKTQLSRLLRLAEDGETVTIMWRAAIPFRPPPGTSSAPCPIRRLLTDEEAEALLRGQ